MDNKEYINVVFKLLEVDSISSTQRIYPQSLIDQWIKNFQKDKILVEDGVSNELKDLYDKNFNHTCGKIHKMYQIGKELFVEITIQKDLCLSDLKNPHNNLSVGSKFTGTIENNTISDDAELLSLIVIPKKIETTF